MNKNQKGLATIIIVLIVAVLIAGGILAWQYFGVPKEEVKTLEEKVEEVPEEIIEDETANWKTYRNEEYGFEIKYPNDWISIIAGANAFGFFPADMFYPETPPILLTVEENTNLHLFLEELEKNRIIEIKERENVLINHLSAVKIVERHPEKGWVTIFCFENQDKNFVIVFGNLSDITEGFPRFENNPITREEITEIFSQMLSTFKFSPH